MTENKTVPKGRTAVMAQRAIDRSGLDYFPTPPWATRALVEYLRLASLLYPNDRVLEPCAGGGHMAEVLRETHEVAASDVHDYGVGYEVSDFRRRPIDAFEWVITNPPFKLAEELLLHVLPPVFPHVGVAMLLRTAWIEGPGRYDRIFGVPERRPSRVMQFAERVSMHAGRWVPGGKSATAYAWVLWEPYRSFSRLPLLDWFGTGTRERCTRPDDVARFAGEVAPCAVWRARGLGLLGARS